MAEKKPISIGSNGLQAEFDSTDTLPAVNIPGATVISPSQITADQDNYSPTGWDTADVVRVSFDSGIRAITGFASWTNGKPKRLVNIGSTTGYIPVEHPDSTAGNRIAGNMEYILEGGGSMVLMYDDTSSRVRVLMTTFNPAMLGLQGRGQFFFQMPGSTNQSDHPFLGLAVAGTGAGNQNDVPTTALLPAWGLITGTTATGASTMFLIKNANASSAFGVGHLCAFGIIYIPTLSDGTQTFTVQVAITASANGTTLAVNNAVGIRYSNGTNSGKWQAFTRDNAGAEGTADSGITVAANTQYVFRIWVDKSRSEARFSITDGTNTYVGRIATNMPNAVTCGVRVCIVKSVGTTSRTLNVASVGHYTIL